MLDTLGMTWLQRSAMKEILYLRGYKEIGTEN